MDLDKLTSSIMQHEGTGPFKDGRYFPYKDSTGNDTIGNGINLSAGITQDENDYLFGNRLQSAIREAQAQAWWPSVADNDARSRAVIEMVYNLGIAGVNGFHDAIECLENADFSGAASNILDSLWHKQVGQRAEILANMILTGSD